jgi:cytochrome c-type protein NapB
MKKHILTLFTFIAVAFSMPAIANADPINQIRDAEIEKLNPSPAMPNTVNDSVKQGRNYPMQPPLIPHKTRDYQVDLNVNKCLSCHARKRTAESQATMISVTHYMDRDGNFLADISPRRYFCQQCHVTQKDLKKLPVENDFVDMDQVMNNKAED